MIIRSDNAQTTRNLGRLIGRLAYPGELIALTGDLGAGKTVLTKGVAEGLGITEPVTSPTFTIMQVYESGRIPMYHFDVYRIEEPEEMEEIGYSEFFFGEGVALVEWAGLIEELIPRDAVRIHITRVRERGDDFREIRIDADETLTEAIEHEINRT